MTRTSKRANNSNENLNILTNDFNNISTIKTIKSATLNPHHLNKTKNPGNLNKFSLPPPPQKKEQEKEFDLLGNILKKLFRRRRHSASH